MKESQLIMMDHSEVKVKLLQLYLERYLNIISLAPGVTDIYLYDLFCGEGIYDNGGKGSPIIILEQIRDTYSKLLTKDLLKGKFHCHFNDIEEWKINKVQREIANRQLHLPEMGSLLFTSCDYRVLLSKVVNNVSNLKREKAFIFIDPYGYKDIRISDIKELLRTQKSEVLLFLPTQFMFRFESKGTPESLKQFINELMPIEQWPASETGIDFIERLTGAFRSSLGANYFVDSFIISRDVNQFFCLFFFTSHIYGFDRMLDAKWKIDDEEGRGWHYASNNSLFNTIEKQPNTLRFERELIRYTGESERTNSELYTFTLHNGHLPQHANDILCRLQDNGVLLARRVDGQKLRKGSFYVNYKEYRDNPEKIKVKYKTH